jgi:hypothetical protein
MKCYCKQDDNGFYYVVEDAPEDKYELIQRAFYERNGNIFLKWYRVDMPDKEIVVPNYERLAPNIFMRNKANWVNALDIFCKIAKKNSINFIVSGSVSACIHGVDILPTDIDIDVDLTDFEKLKECFHEYIIEPLIFDDTLLIVKYFGRLCLDNVWIDVCALPNKGYEVKEIEIKCWNGHIIYVQSLQECLDNYKNMEGKNEQIKKIEDVLMAKK